MKRAVILILLAVFAISCATAQKQSTVNKPAYDSAAASVEKQKAIQDTLDQFYKEVGNEATIADFEKWADDNIPMGRYRATKPLLDAYMNALLQDWITKKRAGPKK